MMAQSAKSSSIRQIGFLKSNLIVIERSLSSIAAGEPHLWSWNGLPLEGKIPTVAKAVCRLKLRGAVLEGEVVALDQKAVTRLQLQQQFQKQPTAPILN